MPEAGFQMRLTGEHQADNAAAVVSAALSIQASGEHSITLDAITSGLASAVLPGRFQVCIVMPMSHATPHIFFI